MHPIPRSVAQKISYISIIRRLKHDAIHII